MAEILQSLSYKVCSTPLPKFVATESSVRILGYQVIPGNDQNKSPTNQKTAGSKLERTS